METAQEAMVKFGQAQEAAEDADQLVRELEERLRRAKGRASALEAKATSAWEHLKSVEQVEARS